MDEKTAFPPPKPSNSEQFNPSHFTWFKTVKEISDFP
jgi:hypothetical protein